MPNNPRSQRLLEQALDEQLAPQERHEARVRLTTNPDDAAELARLQKVETILKTAPMEKAPARLALAIMAKLAQSVKVQPGVSSQALALGLALATLAMLPLLIALGWLAASALASAALLSQIVAALIRMMAALVSALQVFIREAQTLVQQNPEAPALAVGLLLVTLSGVAGYAYWRRRQIREDAAQ